MGAQVNNIHFCISEWVFRLYIVDLWQTIQAFDGFTIPELGSDILVDLLRIFMSGSIKK